MSSVVSSIEFGQMNQFDQQSSKLKTDIQRRMFSNASSKHTDGIQNIDFSGRRTATLRRVVIQLPTLGVLLSLHTPHSSILAVPAELQQLDQ